MKNIVDYENLLYECGLIYESLVQRKTTIRIASRELGIPRSTIHKRIHEIIRRFNPKQYDQITDQLEYNRLYRFKPSKYWSDNEE